jgi:hypothetical protein
VEDPAPDFQFIKDVTDIKLLNQCAYFDQLKGLMQKQATLGH